MEKVLALREFGYWPLQAAFSGQLLRKQNILGNGKSVCRICCYHSGVFSRQTSHALRSRWLNSLNRRKTELLSQAVVIPKRALLVSKYDSVFCFQKTFNSASLLYYSTRPKPHEQSEGGPKSFGDSPQSSKRFDETAPKESSPVRDHSLVENNEVIISDKEDTGSQRPGSKSTDEVVNRDTVTAEEAGSISDAKDGEVAAEKNPGIFKRFRQTYKQYGKVLIGVHIFTSSIWSGLFYTAAISGVNVEPALRWLGASDTIMSFYTMPGVGNVAVAYLMYKLATPARYAVTIGGTHLAVNLLTRWGYMQPIPKADSLRSLVKDGKTKVKAKYEEYHDKMEDMRDELKDLASKEHKLK